jgi:NADH dehydrogenase
MNIPQTNLPRIVVIGCGFAGLKFCKNINTNKYQVVLLDKNNYHTFQPLLYQVASSGLEPDSIVYPIRKIFGGKSNFYFRMAEVNRVDETTQEVHTPIGAIHYDYLLVATGGDSNYFGLTNLQKHAMPMKSLVEALDLRSVIIQCFEKALQTTNIQDREAYMNFVIVGGGPTGVELAGALAELRSHVLPIDYPDLDIRRMQIHLVEAAPRVLAAMSEKSSAKTLKYLHSRHIKVWLDTMVKDYDGELVTTNNQNISAKTVIWAAGIQGKSPQGLNATTTRAYRLEVNGLLQLAGKPHIFALGDVAQVKSEEVPNGHPMLASVAEQQGKYLAKQFNKHTNGVFTHAFQYNDKGTMATFGRNKAVVDMPGFTFGGFFGWVTWMFVHLMLLVDFRSRLVVFINWVWSYIWYDKGTRLIIRKYDKPV